MVTIIDSSTRNNRLLQPIRDHLANIYHAHQCLQRTRSTTSQNICQKPYCAPMCNVLQHMLQCPNIQNCSFPDCVKSRSVILHQRNCQNSNCYICSSSQNLSTNTWQYQGQPIDRNLSVKKINLAIFSIFQADERPVSQYDLTAIQKHAETIEDAAFNTVTSRDDYFKRLAEHINRIQIYSKEKKPVKNPQIVTIALPPSDEQDLKHDNAQPLDDRNHVHAPSVHMTDVSKDLPAKIEIPTAEKHLPTYSGISADDDDHSITTTTKKERISPVIDKTDCPTSLDTTSKLLPKHPAVFSINDIREKMSPILRDLYNQKEGISFRKPVTEAIAPHYFEIIKDPMDFSTIFKKFDENQYTTPFQFWEDMWLVFNNAWTYNKKSHAVYKAAEHLADMFMELVDPIMKDYGYCCGRQYVFLPPDMFCYGVNGIRCTIQRNGNYFVYNNPNLSRNNLSSDKYTFCKKCFDSVKSEYISVGDDPAQTLVELPKVEFHQAKNDHQEQETMVECIVCSRHFHNICVLHHEHIWSEGYVCKQCVTQYNIKRKDNRYLAHKLQMNELANRLEKRVNDFIENECERTTGRVTIRVLAASDQVCKVKPKFKKHFGALVPNGYPYRTKAIFAFQEIEGVDVVLFGMHVQEYGSECPEPNKGRVYISYLDSVHYFQPVNQRTSFYYEVLIGYLEYVKKLGFIYAHIWACPPKKGDDYIFYCHPLEQLIPEAKRLQEWYRTMLDIAVQQRVVVDYKDIMKDCTDNGLNKASDLPYFDGDFFPQAIEDLVEEYETTNASNNNDSDNSFKPEKSTDSCNKRKLHGDLTHKKKKFKNAINQCQISRKNKTNGNDLISKILALIKRQTNSFFVARLQDPIPNPVIIADPDPLRPCDLMESSRETFLNFSRNKHCEFSSLRRAKYSTMVLLIELHSSITNKSSYTCNVCQQQCDDVRYHCTVCEDYDLCAKCNTTTKHEHQIKRSDKANETTTNSDTSVNIQQQIQEKLQTFLEVVRHAVQCQNTNCIFTNCASCKRLIQHIKECTIVPRKQCAHCKQFFTYIGFHAKTCMDQNCSLPYCAGFKIKIQRQRVASMHDDQGSVEAMH